MKAIEHIKLYAESVHLQELGGRDIEQTVAHLVKSTKMAGQISQPKGAMSAERRTNIRDNKE